MTTLRKHRATKNPFFRTRFFGIPILLGAWILGGTLSLIPGGNVARASVDFEYLLTAPDTPTTDPPTWPALTIVTASSTATGYDPDNLCNNAGMTGTMYPQDRHNSTAADMWMSAANDTSPTVTIDLGEIYPLGKMLIWNFNEYTGGIDFSGRGIRTCFIEFSTDGAAWLELEGGSGTGGLFELERATTPSAPTPATNQVGGDPVDFRGNPARFVRFRATDNWGGAPGDGATSYYGLSAVRLYRYASRVRYAGDPIAANVIAESSVYPNNAGAQRIVSNYDMSDAGSGRYGADATVGTQVRWMTTANDPEPYIIFDLGGTYPLADMVVWNFHWAGFGGRGIKNATIYYALGNPGYNPNDVYWPFRGWTRLDGPNADKTWTFTQAGGAPAQGATDTFHFQNALIRSVMIVPNLGLNDGNWGGIQPLDGTDVYLGLSQVRFIAGPGTVVEPLPHWKGLFGQRSQSGRIWGGADGSHSIPYIGPGGEQRYLFTYSDTFKDTWNPKTYARINWQFKNNSSGVYSGPVTDTPRFEDVALDADNTIIPTPALWPSSYYWLNGGVYVPSLDRIFVLGLRVPNGDINSVADHIIALPLVNGEINWAAQEQYDTGHWWVSADETIRHTFTTAMLDRSAKDGYIYIYGSKFVPDAFWGSVKHLIVARVTPENIVNFDEWRFYNGTDWVPGSMNAERINTTSAMGAAAVIPAYDDAHAGQFMAFTLEVTIGSLEVSYAPHPWGPFDTFTHIYAPYENNPRRNPDFYANGVWWYGEAAHPHLSAPGELMISYCTNAAISGYNNLNADLYRPRFLKLRTLQEAPAAVPSAIWICY